MHMSRSWPRLVPTRLVLVACLAATVVPCAAWSQVLPGTGSAAWGPEWRSELVSRSGAVASTSGSLEFLTLGACVALLPKYGMCFTPNAASPYAFVADLDFPGDPDDFFRYKLREDEAVVIVGQTPPEGRYYGLQTYIYSRNESILRNSDATAPCFCDANPAVVLTCGACPANKRRAIAGAIGPNLNHLEVSTGGGAVDPFGQDVVFLITANPEVEDLLRPHLAGMLLEAGASPNIINTEQIPCGGGSCGARGPHLGDLAADDDFATVLRLGMTRSSKEESAYIDSPPAEVFRIRVNLRQPIRGFAPTPRGQPPGPDESSETPYAAALNDLVDALDGFLGGLGTCPRESLEPGSDSFYYPCTLNEGQVDPYQGSCAAPSEDAFYAFSRSLEVAKIVGGGAAWVMGVNHSQASSYSYSNLSVIDAGERVAVAQATDIDYVVPSLPYLAGSVGYYEDELGLVLTAAAPVKDHLFLFKFDATCLDGAGAPNPYCIVIDPADFPSGTMSFWERVYLHTGARTAGRAENFLASTLLVSGPALPSCP